MPWWTRVLTETSRDFIVELNQNFVVRGATAMKDDQYASLLEELNADLAQHLSEDGSGLFIDHPLVRKFVMSLEDVESVNKEYISKTTLIREAIENSDWETYLQIPERAHRLDAFICVQEDFSDRLY
jgi:hypothetical protein